MVLAGAVTTTHWYALRWIEWAGLFGVFLTLLGLYFTWRQARAAEEQACKAETAARAATDAISRTQRQLQANQLLVLVPQLRWLSSELDIAIDADDPIWSRRYLDSWRWQAANIHGLLVAADSSQRKIIKGLQESVGLAHGANSSLLDGKRPVLDACRQARQSIGGVCDLLNVWVGQNQTRTHEPSEGEPG